MQSEIRDTPEYKNMIQARAQELDKLFQIRAAIPQIEHFFELNQDKLDEIFGRMICFNNLFSPDFISAIDDQYIKIISVFLRSNRCLGYDNTMCLCATITMAEWIKPEKKAFFWYIIAETCYPWSGNPGAFFAQDIFMDNDDARKAFIYYQKEGDKYSFVKNTMIGTRDFKASQAMLEGIQNDSVSIFEMHRQMQYSQITITMLQYLLHYDAVQCFIYLLAHYPRQVYKCRTAKEWLFTVCRNSSRQTAVPVIQWMEENQPGIVASARDPWGNTLLWYTLKNRNNSMEEIQETLIALGCDPNVLNRWGLSFQVGKNVL